MTFSWSAFVVIPLPATMVGTDVDLEGSVLVLSVLVMTLMVEMGGAMGPVERGRRV